MHSFMAWRLETQEYFHLLRNKVKHQLFNVRPFFFVKYYETCKLPKQWEAMLGSTICGGVNMSVENTNEQLEDSVGVPQVLMCRPQDVLGPESWPDGCKSRCTTREVHIQFQELLLSSKFRSQINQHYELPSSPFPHDQRRFAKWPYIRVDFVTLLYRQPCIIWNPRFCDWIFFIWSTKHSSHSGTEFTESETNESMTDREVHSWKFRIRRTDKHNHNLFLSGKLNHFTSTKKINGSSYCGGLDFESLPETG
jgi:hypothetical protein